jgi:Ca2+/Na+ antiporter
MLALLGPLASLMGLELDATLGRAKHQALLWGLIAAFGLIAIGFVLVAINAALALSFGPVVAPLIIAAAALVLALVVYLVFHLIAAREARREAERQKTTEMTALIATTAIAALPLLLPTLRKVALPAGGVAAATYALLRARPSKRDD